MIEDNPTSVVAAFDMLLEEIEVAELLDDLAEKFLDKYAESIRERKRGAAPRDFDLIGTEFHRWVRDREEALGLRASADFAGFIQRNFAFYARQYHRLRQEGRLGLEAGAMPAAGRSDLESSTTLAGACMIAETGYPSVALDQTGGHLK